MVPIAPVSPDFSACAIIRFAVICDLAADWSSGFVAAGFPPRHPRRKADQKCHLAAGVHQNIHPFKRVNRGRQQIGDSVSFLPQIARKHPHGTFRPRFFAHLGVKAVFVHIDEHHIRPLVDEMPGDGKADAIGGPVTMAVLPAMENDMGWLLSALVSDAAGSAARGHAERAVAANFFHLTKQRLSARGS